MKRAGHLPSGEEQLPEEISDEKNMRNDDTKTVKFQLEELPKTKKNLKLNHKSITEPKKSVVKKGFKSNVVIRKKEKKLQ
ncbi:unnamed protein product [Heterobilharzia americana]|nr:unnamed protein product [Heterobilharzia americana]